MFKPQLLEDEIARKLAEAEKSGELRSAQGYGKPFEADAGWDQTPEEIRMGFKILKKAGLVPPEVELFHERARLRAALGAVTTQEERQVLQTSLSSLEQRLAIRLETLRVRGSL